VPITLGGIRLPAGMYTLWTVPHTHAVDLIVNKQTGQWGTGYNAKFDIGKAPMAMSATTSSVEKFTISINSTDAHHGTLVMAWGTFRWTALIVVS
jgi:ABC-type thiamine transport system substrate-binding protein